MSIHESTQIGPAIPLGSRVQYRQNPRWVGTVTGWDPKKEFPYRVAWDNTALEDVAAGELIQLTRPHLVPSGTLEHYRQVAADAAFDAGTGQERR